MVPLQILGPKTVRCHPSPNFALDFLFLFKPPITGILILQSILTSSNLSFHELISVFNSLGLFSIVSKHVFLTFVLRTKTLFAVALISC